MAIRSNRPKPACDTKLALGRVQALLDQADSIYDKSPQLADRYALLAKRIALKVRLRLPPSLKRRLCKRCSAFLIPGKTARIRTARGHVVIYCQKCKNTVRVGYSKPSKSKS